MAKYKITNTNMTKVNVSIAGKSNAFPLMPGADLYLGEISDCMAENYRRAYNGIGCIVSKIGETPVNACIIAKIPPEKNKCCETAVALSSDSEDETKTKSSLDDLAKEEMQEKVVQKKIEEDNVKTDEETIIKEEEVVVEEEKHEESSESTVEANGYGDLEDELNAMTKNELLEKAAELGLSVKSTSTKGFIKEALLAHSVDK